MVRLKKSFANSLLLACITASWPALAEDMPFNAANVVADSALDKMRGGIELPNGVDLSIGIDIQTSVNGALVLHSTFSTDTPKINVTHAFSDGLSTSAGPGQEAQIPVQVNGAAINTSFGTVVEQTGAQGTVVNLTNQSISIQHLIGQTSGAIVANTANNQAINTVITMNIDVKGISPAITNNLFLVNELAASATIRPRF